MKVETYRREGHHMGYRIIADKDWLSPYGHPQPPLKLQVFVHGEELTSNPEDNDAWRRFILPMVNFADKTDLFFRTHPLGFMKGKIPEWTLTEIEVSYDRLVLSFTGPGDKHEFLTLKDDTTSVYFLITETEHDGSRETTYSVSLHGDRTNVTETYDRLVREITFTPLKPEDSASEDYWMDITEYHNP